LPACFDLAKRLTRRSFFEWENIILILLAIKK
jgi:hypothetical protein